MARNVLGTQRMTTTKFDEVAAPAWSIRPEQPLDLDQIHDLHREAFGRLDEAELVDAIRSGPDFIPELSLVAAAADGSVLGHVLISRIGFEEEEFAVRGDVLSLAPLAVLPPHGGRGIASALTAQALAEADKRDEPFVFVLGSPSFYARFGFIAASDFGIESPYTGCGPRIPGTPEAERTGAGGGDRVLPADVRTAPGALASGAAPTATGTAVVVRRPRLGPLLSDSDGSGVLDALHGRRSASPPVTAVGSARRSASATATGSESGTESG